MENNVQIDSDLEKTFKSVLTIGYLTSTSVVVYGLVTFLILKNSTFTGASGDNVNSFRIVFMALGAAIFGLIPFIKSKLLKIPEVEEEVNLNKRLQSCAVIIFGLCETIAVLGLVLSVLTQNIQDYYWLGLVSFAAFFYHFPKYEQWQEYVNNVRKF